MVRRFASWMIAALFVAGPAAASAGSEEIFPGAVHDPAIPTLAAGGRPRLRRGDHLARRDRRSTSPRSSGRRRSAPGWSSTARSWEGRPLHLLDRRLAGADRRRSTTSAPDSPASPTRADLAPAEAEALIPTLPVVVWLLHGVHGNEISLARRGARRGLPPAGGARGRRASTLVLRESLVLIDPLQNPDGRARFLVQNLLGRAAAARPRAARRRARRALARRPLEPLPLRHEPRLVRAHAAGDAGRGSALALDCFPQVVVDLHEMGGDHLLLRAARAAGQPLHLAGADRRWLELFGRANADALRRARLRLVHARGLRRLLPRLRRVLAALPGRDRHDLRAGLAARPRLAPRATAPTLTLREARRPATSPPRSPRSRPRRGTASACCATSCEFRRSAVDEGQRGPVREYLLVPGSDPSRAERLARLLAAQGIEVRRADEPRRSARGASPRRDLRRRRPRSRPAGCCATCSTRTRRSTPAFVAEQDRRRRERLPDEIYDVTAWSLPGSSTSRLRPPLGRAARRPLDSGRRTAARAAGGRTSPPARVGYLVPWGAAAAAAVNEALRAGLAVRVAGEPFTLGGPTTRDRRHAVPDRRQRSGARVAAGRDRRAPRRRGGAGRQRLGRRRDLARQRRDAGAARAARPARLGPPGLEPVGGLDALGARAPLRPAGHRGAHGLAPPRRARRYDALVLPSGDYSKPLDDEAVERLRGWVRARRHAGDRRRGLALGGRTRRSACSRRPPSCATARPREAGEGDDGEPARRRRRTAARPLRLRPGDPPRAGAPRPTPGAVLRVELDREHWLSAGTDGEIQARGREPPRLHADQARPGAQRRRLRRGRPAGRRRPGLARGARRSWRARPS